MQRIFDSSNDIESRIPTISDEWTDDTNSEDSQDIGFDILYEKPTRSNYMRRMLYNVSSICSILIVICVCYWSYYEVTHESIDYDDPPIYVYMD